MANKLKDLKVTKVDFVDAGANPEANVVIFKRAEQAVEGSGEDEHRAQGGVFKRIIAAIAKAVGATDAQVDAAVEEIAKGGEAETFGEKMVQRQLRRTADEIWDFCYALQESLCSILRDQDVLVPDKPGLMTQSCTEFSAAVAAAIPKWATGVPAKVEKSARPEMTEERLQIAKEAKARLEDMIQKAGQDEEPTAGNVGESDTEPDEVIRENNMSKGEKTDMKIDKSKLSAEELTALEAIEKKAGIQEETPAADTPTAEPVNKSTEPVAESTGSDTDDIYKGLHPAVKAELERLRKAADAAEEKELLAVAKKYELLGKKPEELAPVLKSLKAAGGTAYDDMIGILDANLAVVQGSPAFTEIGKRGTGSSTSDRETAWATIEKKADEIMKSDPNISRAQAVDKACQQNPELVHQYENDR